MTSSFLFRAVLGALLLLSAPAALAQSPTSSVFDDIALARTATAQGNAAEALSRYLRVLSRNPQDMEALTGAGRAALDIGDANAAISFYARAEEIAPRNGQVKAGLGSAMVDLEQPKAALKLFDEALALGVSPADVASDRGLAYDLRGDNRHAQTEYMIALRSRNDPEATRRLALSQAMGGDRTAALATVDPLLRLQDKAAWRARAFIYAITGDSANASSTAHAVLAKPQADALTPFLAKMAKLKPSQQAAAVHFGHFPSEGRTYASSELFAENDAPPSAAGPETPLKLKRPGTPLQPPASIPRPQADQVAGRLQSENGPVADDEYGDGIGIDAPAGSARTARASAQSSGPRPVPAANLPARASSRVAVEETGQIPEMAIAPPKRDAGEPLRPASKPDLTAMKSAAAARPAPEAQTVPTRTCTTKYRHGRRVKVCTESETAKVDKPASDQDCISAKPARHSHHVAADAKCTAKTQEAKAESGPAKSDKDKNEDCTSTKASSRHGRRGAKPHMTCKTELASKDRDGKDSGSSSKSSDEDCAPSPRSHHRKASRNCEDKLAKSEGKTEAKTAAKEKEGSERYWVQVAVGAYKPDLGKEWTKLKGKYPSLLGRFSPSSIPLNRTNRLLVGPFKSAQEMQAFVNKAGQAGFGTSPYTSPAGAHVEPVN